MQVGCMGFCMGGALSFLAGQDADVDAIAPFYGTPDPKLAKVRKCEYKVQGRRIAVCAGSNPSAQLLTQLPVNGRGAMWCMCWAPNILDEASKLEVHSRESKGFHLAEYTGLCTEAQPYTA